jgi:hypothetical protein
MADNQIQFPEKIQQALQPDAKKEPKMMIARGLLPMPPAVLIEALRLLTQDPDTEVQKTSTDTVQKLPENILINIAQTQKISATLDFLARIHVSNERILEKILINQNTNDSTFLFAALQSSEKLSTLIANNQVRILRTPEIAEKLKKNPNMLQSEMDRLASFLRMNGIVLEGESAELSLAEIEAILKTSEDPAEAIPMEFLEDNQDEPAEKVRQSVFQYIQSINTGKKIKLALKGNKEARAILIKDSNKVISSAVIKNPRITDGEIHNVCQNKSINDEILRLVCMKPDWVKHYSIQLALANNPKTPFQLALRFARMLTIGDLKKLGMNKNANGQIQKISKELYENKRGK